MMTSKLLPVVLCVLHVYASKLYVYLELLIRAIPGAESGFVGWEGATYNARKTWGRDPFNDLKQRLKHRKDAHYSRTNPSKTYSNQTRWLDPHSLPRHVLKN